MMTLEKTTTQLSWLNRINIIYGALGLAFTSQAFGAGAWKSFFVGWFLAVLNLELLKRLGISLLAYYDGRQLSPLFFVFLFGKFVFWGLVIALFSMASWLQGVPFSIGMTTLLISGLGLGMRELIYAR